MSTGDRQGGADSARDRAEWHDANHAFLQAAVAWVVARLESLAAGQQTGGAVGSSPPARPARRLFRRRSLPAPVGGGTSRGPARVGAERVESARQAMERAAAACRPGTALAYLARRFQLTPFEGEVLLLTAAMELNTGVGWLCAAAQRDAQAAYPTFGLALALFDGAHWSAVTPERPLRAWKLVEFQRAGSQPLIGAPLRIDERFLTALKGHRQVDERLTRLIVPAGDATATHELPASHESRVAEVLDHWNAASLAGVWPPLIQLVGSDATGKWQVASEAARRCGHRVLRLPAEDLDAAPGEIDALARLWEREALLLPSILYLDADDRVSHTEAGPGPDRSLVVARFLARTHSRVLLATRDPAEHTTRPSLSVEVTKPTAREQSDAWSKALGLSVPAATDPGRQPTVVTAARNGAAGQPQPGAPARPAKATDDAPARLVSQFNMDWPTIQRLARRVTRPGQGLDFPALWQLCRAATRPRLDGLARRIDARATWNDLVLADRPVELLKRVAAQARNRYRVYSEWGFEAQSARGLGVTVLFSGASGTGKTMAAEVIANDLGVDLYRVDCSAVVSKYIGETEKNLRLLLDSFEDCGAVLLFDEADSLYSRRTDVKDSLDRYGNQEVNYLLQRLESYRGVAVLCTNLPGAIDRGFLRRLRWTIEFSAPAAADRLTIWQKVLPAALPRAGLDLNRLADEPLTGGSIRVVALNAAFEAASEGSVLTMDHVLRAVREEQLKLGQPTTVAERTVPAPKARAAPATAPDRDALEAVR
jgi:hypothetical protein